MIYLHDLFHLLERFPLCLVEVPYRGLVLFPNLVLTISSRKPNRRHDG